MLVYVLAPFFLSATFKNNLKYSSLFLLFILDKSYLLALTGLTGAIISPYLFFGKTSAEAEDAERGCPEYKSTL